MRRDQPPQKRSKLRKPRGSQPRHKHIHQSEREKGDSGTRLRILNFVFPFELWLAKYSGYKQSQRGAGRLRAAGVRVGREGCLTPATQASQ